VGAYLIDPVAQHWDSDIDAMMLRRRGGVHFNPNFERYYADKVIENLEQMFDRKPTLLVVGDSPAPGTGDPSIVTYPYLLADKMGWNLALDGQVGTGFVNGIDSVSPPRVPFIDRLDGDAATYASHVEYVLVDGGRNDLGLPPERVVAAADEYIKKVHSDWPNAKIIIILPTFPTPDVAANYPAVSQGLRRTAETVGAYVIDPVEQRWYRGIDVKPLLWHDGIHLNGKGETYYADKIIENLKQMGFGS